MEDFYKLLGVPHDSDHDKIKLHCHQLTLKHHPDKSHNKTEESHRIFLQVTKAKETLLNPQKRCEYDRCLKEEKLKRFHRPIFSEENLSDLEFFEEEDAYVMECRCGGRYTVTEDLITGKDIVVIPCDNCTYYLEVHCKTDT